MGLFKRKKIGKTISSKGRYRQTALPTQKRREAKRNKIQKNTEKKVLKTKQAQKQFKKTIRPIIIIAAGLIIYVISHLLFISEVFTITKIEYDSSNIEVIDENPILNYLQNFKGENILLINTDDEEIYLKQTYPEYKKIEVKKSLPHTLILELSPYDLAANLIQQAEGVNKKFIISENGLLTEENTQDPSLPYIYIKTEDMLILGKMAMEENSLAFILEAITDFQNKFGMQVLDATYYRTAREVHLRTERYFDVWLDTQIEVDEQLNKLKQALPKINIYEDPLSYIDLRISGQSGDKVIYMPK
ncbi:MAG: hypothetical protein ABII07_04630 [Patescibacteria group bacterium]|nr:hypothetical protein [Patescibacteria group bacterium]